MTWMKVDDGFHSSPKLQSIPARHRFQAAGLWVIAGSWASQQMTDGFIPDYMIAMWKPTAKTVDSLVSSGLWERVRDGFAFRSWCEYNPSKQQTMDERDASKARMRDSRERRKNKTAGQEVETPNVAAQHPNSDAVPRPDPTRPDPSPKGEVKDHDHPDGAIERNLVHRFDEFWAEVPKGRKSGKDDARRAFARAVQRAKGGADEIIDGMRRYAADPNLPEDLHFVKLPATWLNKGCWDDEPLPPRKDPRNAGKSLSGPPRAETARPGDLLGILRQHRQQPTHAEATILDTQQELTA